MIFRDRVAQAGEWLIGKNGRWLLLFTSIFLLTRIFAANRSLTEFVYSRGLYPLLSGLLGFLSDLAPFSLQEWVVIGGLIYLLLCIWRGAGRLRRKETNLKTALRAVLRRTLILLCILYASFYLLWGFNYFRILLADEPAFARPGNINTLITNLLSNTINEANKLHRETFPDPDKINQSIEVKLGEALLSVTGTNPPSASRVKVSTTGWLSAMGISGITLPFLQEAHLAGDLLSFEKPFIAAHEKAHLKGRTSEAEANFFAWLACTTSEHPAIRYSGHFSILGYLLGAIPPPERGKWIRTINPGVIAHFRLQKERNRKQSKLLSNISRSLNNLYLKANKIKGGIRNYSMVVELAIAWINRTAIPKR